MNSRESEGVLEKVIDNTDTRQAEKVIQQSSLSLPKAYKSQKSRLIAIDSSAPTTDCKNSRFKTRADHPVSYDSPNFPVFPKNS